MININTYSLEKKILYLIFFTGFFGVALFSVNLGIFTLFPYRFFLLFLALLFFIKITIKGKLIFYQKAIKYYIYFLIFWLGYSMISIVWAISKEDAIRDIIFLLMGILLIYFSTFYVKNEKNLKMLYNIWVISFGILIIIGFWEIVTSSHLPSSKYYNEAVIRVVFRPSGSFYNTNDFASFLSLSIPFGIAMFRYYSRILLRLFGIIVVLLSFYLIVETGSRSNIIAVLLELIFIFLFLMNISKKAKFIYTTIILASILFIFFGSNVFQIFGKITEEITSIERQARLMQGSVFIRFNIIKNSFYFLYSTAGFGVGAGNAEYYMANYSQYYTAGILNPHNWWLEILVNYGILVFFGYALFYMGIIRNLWKIYRNTLLKVEKMICEALLVSMVGFFFASISSSSILAFKPQWLLFAFALSFINYFHRKKEIEEL